MSGDAQISGRINITPPITWPELVDKEWAHKGNDRWPDGYWTDAKVHLDHLDVTTDVGILNVLVGVAIVAQGGETSAYTLTRSVQRIVDAFGTAPDGTARTFAGYLHVVWAGGEDMWRVHVVDGRAVESRPELTWPAGATDDDSVENETGTQW